MKEKLAQIKTLLDQVILELEMAEATPRSELKFDPPCDEFNIIGDLLNSESWPEAVFPAQIADLNSETDKDERAQGISNILLPPLDGKRFLDFGCGEGHLAAYASKEAEYSVGYDILAPKASRFEWDAPQQSMLLTTDFGSVKEHGPYDVILLYDVVDHCESPSELLEMAKSVLAPEGRLYMRCHPWCSRHGGHAYRFLNKAFAHLIFSEEELRTMGVELEKVVKVVRPLDTYAKMIAKAGLVLDSDLEVDHQQVESFFRDTPPIARRILKRWGVSSWSDDPPEFQMSMCFLDYVLKKK